MEDILKQILSELKGIKTEIGELKTGQARLEAGQQKLHQNLIESLGAYTEKIVESEIERLSRQ
ncbi:hypothetical protein [Falsibacillus pallidus]|uniref:Uncharacterized protein n=1 Tax=Falsibacillus pallidus TaxID=493781 RepID=A0A370G5D0_9BACI|nr:hypothetical protein [Falsibacillus pallidus]RDI38029.1 hypothetical protein DFR59_11941 [Falsibacillus pallidus]